MEERSVDPFASSGLTRSPPGRTAETSGVTSGETSGATSGETGEGTDTPTVMEVNSVTNEDAVEVVLDGPGLLRAVEKRREMLPRMVALAEQLDAIIGFTSSRSNISKDLKQSLLLLRSTVRAAGKEREALETRLVLAERGSQKASKSVQTQVFTFAGNNTMANESMEYVTSNAGAGAGGSSRKRGRKSLGEGAPGGSKRRRTTKGRQDRAGGNKDGGNKPGGNKPGGNKTGGNKAGGNKGGGNNAGSNNGGSDVQDHDTEQEDEEVWVPVEHRKKKRRRTEKELARRRMARKRNRGDALVIKTERPQFAVVLKTLRKEGRLADLGADVRNIRHSRSGEIILELKRDTTQKGSAYKPLVEQILGEGVEVRALTTEVTLQCKNLDEITDESEVAEALKTQCAVEVSTTAIRLRKGPFGTQVAMIRLPVAAADLALKVPKFKVGWSVCSLSMYQPPDSCFRCFEPGHKSWECKGPDRSNLCRRCGVAGHKARDCDKPPKCMICSGKPEDKHVTGGPKCPAFRQVTKRGGGNTNKS